MKVKQKLEADGLMAATRTDLRNAQRETWSDVGLEWHRTMKAEKFTKAGAAKHNFTPRRGDYGSGVPFKGSYTQAKILRRRNGQGVRSIGENRPNVWSGQSRSQAMASNKVTAKAKSFDQGSVDIHINAPALNFKNPKSKVHPSKEVTSVNQPQLSTLEGFAGKRFESHITSARRKKTFTS
jgi:hypothetical protein